MRLKRMETIISTISPRLLYTQTARRGRNWDREIWNYGWEFNFLVSPAVRRWVWRASAFGAWDCEQRQEARGAGKGRPHPLRGAARQTAIGQQLLAHVQCVQRLLGAVGQVQLGEDVADMSGDGVGRRAQAAGDLFRLDPAGGQAQDGQFRLGEIA